MKLYGVYDNMDHTEGRGPMVLESLWFDEENAVKHIQKLSGVKVPHTIGETIWYCGFYYLKVLETSDELNSTLLRSSRDIIAERREELRQLRLRRGIE